MNHDDEAPSQSIRTVVFDFGGVFAESPTAVARALMVDDFAESIDGAESIGMRGILVGEDPAQRSKRLGSWC